MINAFVGFLTGLLASMGLGGGFVLVIWLTVFQNVQQGTAQGINVLFFLPIALLSLVIHLKNGLIDRTLLKKYILGGVLGAVAGTLLSGYLDSDLLRTLFAVFLLLFGVRELISSGRADKNTRNPDKLRENRTGG